MIEELRREFNERYTEAGYARLLRTIDAAVRTPVGFRVAETPVFLPQSLVDRMVATGVDLTRQLLDNAEYMAASTAVIPARFRVAEPGGVQPHFMTVDFGFVREADGALGFRLVEMQAFPSVFGFQDVAGAAYIEAYGLDRGLNPYLGGHDQASYWKLLDEVIVAGHDPAEVVLLEVTPELQKTRADFQVYEDRLALRTVDITKVRQTGRRLEYERDGRWVPIRRIFNRAIVDEMEREGIRPGFDLRADLEVEWAGHPNWYFRASKFSLPYLNHAAVPKAVFLDAWMGDPSLLPVDLSATLLKPLFSFAGKGIEFAPTLERISCIPEDERRSYLLQERMHFEPVIVTPEGGTQAEVRLMFVWPDGGEMQPVISMVRLGRGLMMGVDHNRDKAWVGASAGLLLGCAEKSSVAPPSELHSAESLEGPQ